MLNVADTHFQAVATSLNIPLFRNYRDKYLENRFWDRLGSQVAVIAERGAPLIRKCGNPSMREILVIT